MHDLTMSTCTICLGKDDDGKGGTDRGPIVQLDTPEAVEPYRSRYPGDREATFDAYVEVFFGDSEARDFPGGWTKFSRCANAEPALVAHESRLVAKAEAIMRRAGYVADDSGRSRGGGRKWVENR